MNITARLPSLTGRPWTGGWTRCFGEKNKPKWNTILEIEKMNRIVREFDKLNWQLEMLYDKKSNITLLLNSPANAPHWYL